MNSIADSDRLRATVRHQADRLGHAAFSLLELVVVLLVIGVLTAAAVPTFYRSLNHHRLESAARRVKLDLEYARDTARARSVAIAMEFSGTSYTIDDPAIEDLDHGGAYVVNLSAAPFQLDGVTADFDGDQQIAFDGYGTPSADGEIVLQLAGDTRTLSVDSSTGQISVTAP